MASVYKVLGQVSPAATTATTLYTVPALTSAVCSTLSICNYGVSTTYRIAIRPGGVTLANQHYITYNAGVNANETTFLTLGITFAQECKSVKVEVDSYTGERTIETDFINSPCTF